MPVYFNISKKRSQITICRELYRVSATAVCMAALVATGGGCLQIETRVRVEKDGGATVTERVRLSRRLLDLARMRKAVKLEDCLKKQHVLKRVEKMGKGARLISHKISNAEMGSKECVSVIKIPDMNHLRYVSPFLGQHNYQEHTVLAFKLAPIIKSRSYGMWPGKMYVAVRPETSERGKKTKGAPPPTPRDLQVYRDLKPLFRDMLDGFRVRLIVESYARIGMARGYYHYRGEKSGTKQYDLIDFSWKDYDRYGRNFLDNEEIMLELLQFQMSGGDLMRTIKTHANDGTVPVYHPHGIPNITFRPSQRLFDRHFKGKKVFFGKRQGGPRMANYKEIGLQDEKTETGSKPPDREKTK